MRRRKELDDLIAAFGRKVHGRNPNPDRTGCPGPLALEELAKQSPPSISGPLLEHIRFCAVCLDKLKELRLKAKSS